LLTDRPTGGGNAVSRLLMMTSIEIASVLSDMVSQKAVDTREQLIRLTTQTDVV